MPPSKPAMLMMIISTIITVKVSNATQIHNSQQIGAMQKKDLTLYTAMDVLQMNVYFWNVFLLRHWNVSPPECLSNWARPPQDPSCCQGWPGEDGHHLIIDNINITGICILHHHHHHRPHHHHVMFALVKWRGGKKKDGFRGERTKLGSGAAPL